MMVFEELHCEYSWASGADFEDCAFLARRWRDEYGTTLPVSDFLVFYITKMPGLAPDLRYAAGRGGMARWNGRAWDELPMPTGEVLSDEIIGTTDGEAFFGTAFEAIEESAAGVDIAERRS